MKSKKFNTLAAFASLFLIFLPAISNAELLLTDGSISITTSGGENGFDMSGVNMKTDRYSSENSYIVARVMQGDSGERGDYILIDIRTEKPFESNKPVWQLRFQDNKGSYALGSYSDVTKFGKNLPQTDSKKAYMSVSNSGETCLFESGNFAISALSADEDWMEASWGTNRLINKLNLKFVLECQSGTKFSGIVDLDNSLNSGPALIEEGDVISNPVIDNLQEVESATSQDNAETNAIDQNNNDTAEVEEVQSEESNVASETAADELNGSECIDIDGDGWGWNGVESCRIAGFSPVRGECVDSDGDGWGWNGVESCRVNEAQQANENPETEPTDNEVVAVAPTGDTETSSSAISESAPEVVVGECVDTDGDGWGWNGSASCRIADLEPTETAAAENEIAPSTEAVEEVEEIASNTDITQEEDEVISEEVVEVETTATTAPVNEVVPSTEPVEVVEEIVSDPSIVEPSEPEVPGPVAPVTSRPNVTPCPEDMIIPNNGCWGYIPGEEGEEGESCRKVDCVDPLPAATVACAPLGVGKKITSSILPAAEIGKEICAGPGNQYVADLAYGDFILSNNAWAAQHSNFDWSQCIRLAEGADGNVIPTWTYNWGNEEDRHSGFHEHDLKSYPEIIYGVKERAVSSGSCAQTGLPIPYTEMPKINIDFKYSVSETTNYSGNKGYFDLNANATEIEESLADPENKRNFGAERNIAFESFFHTTCDIARNIYRDGTLALESNHEFEVMVWLDVGYERLPSGPNDLQDETFTDSNGNEYYIYIKDHDKKYLGFVAKNPPILEGNLNWNEFVDHAVQNGEKYGTTRFNKDWCLGNILFGSEIWWGEGDVKVEKLEITSEY